MDLQWTGLDAAVFLGLLLGTLIGLRRGLSGELARLIGAAAVVYAGLRFHGVLADRLLEHTRVAPPAAPALAFFLLLLGGLLAFALLRRLLQPLLRFGFPGGLERAGGAAAGLTRSGLLLLAMLFFLELTPVDYLQPYVFEKSLTGRIYREYLAEPLHRAWADYRSGSGKGERNLRRRRLRGRIGRAGRTAKQHGHHFQKDR